MLSIDDVRDAAARVRDVVHRTPILRSRTLDEQVGARVFLKAECSQRAGSFKIRGAFNRMSRLSPDELARGVAAYSSGNHAQAVALAARLLGTPAVIVMPSDAPASKVDATRGYGAEIVFYDRYTGDREAIGAALAEDRGMTLVPPYEDRLVMAGQGTAALELLEDAPDMDALVVPMGGGGLMAGCSTVAKALRPSIVVMGVEPATGDDQRRSLEAGERVVLPGVPETVADGLMATTPGELTFDVNRRTVDTVVTVSDEEMVEAMRFLFERMKVVVEPSGAVGVAALMAGGVDVAAGSRIGVILSGGNVDAARFADLVTGSVGPHSK
jgi:threonine dehydratase